MTLFFFSCANVHWRLIPWLSLCEENVFQLISLFSGHRRNPKYLFDICTKRLKQKTGQKNGKMSAFFIVIQLEVNSQKSTSIFFFNKKRYMHAQTPSNLLKLRRIHEVVFTWDAISAHFTYKLQHIYMMDYKMPHQSVGIQFPVHAPRGWWPLSHCHIYQCNTYFGPYTYHCAVTHICTTRLAKPLPTHKKISIFMD